MLSWMKCIYSGQPSTFCVSSKWWESENNKPVTRWRLRLLHGLELQTLRHFHWFSLLDTLLKCSKTINALHLALKRHMCRRCFLKWPLAASGKSASAKEVVSCWQSCLFSTFALSSTLPLLMLQPMVVGCRHEIWLPINGRHAGGKCLVLFLQAPYISRACPHNENALELMVMIFKSRVRLMGTNWLHDWHLNSFPVDYVMCNFFLGELWKISVYSQVIQRQFALKSSHCGLLTSLRLYL